MVLTTIHVGGLMPASKSLLSVPIILGLVTLTGCSACGCGDHPESEKSPTAIRQKDLPQSAEGEQLSKVFNDEGQHLDPRLQVLSTFDGPMPTGVTVSRSGRIFVCFPKWGDRVEFTVGEVVHGRAVAYPNLEINRDDSANPSRVLVSVQSVVVDPRDRLWLLDTGSVQFGPTMKGGPKLVCVDLNTNEVVKTILVPADVALPTTYLNDVRFDLRRGDGGYAYITDSSTDGPNGIIVVDLGSGKSWRKLNDDPTTKAEKNFTATVEGQPLLVREPGSTSKPVTFGSDGIAISADGSRLMYCPLSSRALHSVSTDALIDRGLADTEVAKTIQDMGRKGAADGLETDSQNRLYSTDYEHHAIHRRSADGRMETIVDDPRLIWPDTLSLASDGYLYFIVNQLDRMPKFHGGKDLRTKPYALCRVKVDAEPVRLLK
jgi:sugar lactone lactonase YvrE